MMSDFSYAAGTAAAWERKMRADSAREAAEERELDVQRATPHNFANDTLIPGFCKRCGRNELSHTNRKE
jgi:hypothetical protein